MQRCIRTSTNPAVIKYEKKQLAWSAMFLTKSGIKTSQVIITKGFDVIIFIISIKIPQWKEHMCKIAFFGLLYPWNDSYFIYIHRLELNANFVL
jgi:hypothetical protein